MKKFRIQNLTGGILWALLLITIVVFAVFFLGGETPVEQRLVADTSISEPAQTDVLMYWVYTLVFATIIVTLLAAVIQLGASFKDSPKAAFQSLLGFILLIVLMVVTYSMGSNEPLQLVGYTGTDNQAPWLKIGDMFIFTIGFMISAMVVLMIVFGVKNRLKL